MRPIRLGLVLLALAAFAPTPRANACPDCKGALAEQDGGQKLADGYSWSILVMIGMPMALLGTGSFLVYRAAKDGLIPEL